MEWVFFFKQKTAYEISACLVGSERCIRNRIEKNIVDYYQSNRHQEYDTKRYLLTALQCLRSLPIYEFQRKTLESAISNVQEAINDEEQFPTSAMSELKKVIGEL